MSFIVIDTDVASALIKGTFSGPLRTRLVGRSLCISSVTLGELSKWATLRNWGPGRRAELASWRRDVVLLPLGEQAATTGGRLQARAQRRGRPRPINDSWIAATCIAAGLPLATLNVKDFEDFAE